MAKYFRYQGIEKEECRELLINWMNEQDTTFYNTKLEVCIKEIDHIYQYVYDNDIQLTIQQQDLEVTYDEMVQILKLNSKNEKLLMYCLMIHGKRFALQSGTFYMSFPQMVLASGLSERTVKRIVPTLAEIGLIEIVEQNRKQKGTCIKKPNRYKINIQVSETNNQIFKLACNDMNYSDSFNHCIFYLFDKGTLKEMLPRRQFESIVNM